MDAGGETGHGGLMGILVAEGTASLEFCDYFNKFGFEDGDNDELVGAALRRRPAAVRILREEVRKVHLDLTICADDAGSIHNNCRIDVFAGPNEDGGGGDDYYVDINENGKVTGQGHSLTKRQVVALNGAIKKAMKRFYDECGSPGSYRAGSVFNGCG